MATVPSSLKSLNNHSSDVSKGDMFSVSPHLLLEEEGFNSRGAFIDDYWEQPEVIGYVEGFASAYKSGKYVPPITVVVRDGKVFIRDGHHRHRGLMLAIERGAEIKKVPVLELKNADEAQQALFVVTANNNRQLSPLERAVIFQRLEGWGWTVAEIASHTNLTEARVKQMLELMALPIELKRLIQQDKVSASYAAELYAQHGTKAVEMVSTGLSSSGTAKVTKKHVEKANKANAAPRMGKKLVEALRVGMVSLASRIDNAQPSTDGTFTVSLSADELESLRALKTQLAELEAEPAQPEPEPETVAQP